jgi:hypothetical protein
LPGPSTQEKGNQRLTVAVRPPLSSSVVTQASL